MFGRYNYYQCDDHIFIYICIFAVHVVSIQ